MMKQKTLIVLAVFLAAIGLIYLGMYTGNQRRQEKNEAAEKESQIKVTTFATDDVSKITFFNGTEDITFQRTDDTWYIPEDESFQVDQDKIAALLHTVADLNAQAQVDSSDAQADDTSQYGFDNPTFEVEVTLNDGSTQTLVYGMQNEITSQYYVMTGDDNQIYAVDASAVNEISKSLEDFRAEESDEASAETNAEAVTDAMNSEAQTDGSEATE